jgi:hypothetical protein
MFHTCVQRFDVMGNLEKFYKILETKQHLAVSWAHMSFLRALPISDAPSHEPADSFYKAIRTHGPLYSSSICPSQHDFLLYTQFSHTHLSSISSSIHSNHCEDTLVTLSKYIHVLSSFEGFIETNLMVQSKFNLD